MGWASSIRAACFLFGLLTFGLVHWKNIVNNIARVLSGGAGILLCELERQSARPIARLSTASPSMTSIRHAQGLALVFRRHA